MEARTSFPFARSSIALCFRSATLYFWVGQSFALSPLEPRGLHMLFFLETSSHFCGQDDNPRLIERELASQLICDQVTRIQDFGFETSCAFITLLGRFQVMLSPSTTVHMKPVFNPGPTKVRMCFCYCRHHNTAGADFMATLLSSSVFLLVTCDKLTFLLLVTLCARPPKRSSTEGPARWPPLWTGPLQGICAELLPSIGQWSVCSSAFFPSQTHSWRNAYKGSGWLRSSRWRTTDVSRFEHR